MARSSGTDNTTILGGRKLSGPARDTERLHYLALIAGDKPGQRIRLGNQPLVIGRAAPADWILADGEVSRTHCKVFLALDEVIVVDLKSSNGTFIEGRRITEGSALPIGARLQIGAQVIEHQWLTREEFENLQSMHQDVEKAAQYIQSHLPKPLRTGAVRCQSLLVPSARLGGDAFGYRWLDDERRIAIYMLDVSGHGAPAAMHAISVLNILGRGALPVTDFYNPANVLDTINVMFESKFHSGMSVSVWYGVYDTETRRLKFATAGHHPAYLVPPARDHVIPLETDTPEIGVKKGYKYKAARIDVKPKSMLYVFSDGAFEFTAKGGATGTMDDFGSLVLLPPEPGKPEPQRLLEQVQRHAQAEALEDDFALMAFTFL